jgi:predicted glycosyltransferase
VRWITSIPRSESLRNSGPFTTFRIMRFSAPSAMVIPMITPCKEQLAYRDGHKNTFYVW